MRSFYRRYNIRNFNGISLEQCKQECEKDKACMSIDYAVQKTSRWCPTGKCCYIGSQIIGGCRACRNNGFREYVARRLSHIPPKAFSARPN